MKKTLSAISVIIMCFFMCSCTSQRVVTHVMSEEEQNAATRNGEYELYSTEIYSRETPIYGFLGVTPGGELVFRRRNFYDSSDNNSYYISVESSSQTESANTTYMLSDNVTQCRLINNGETVLFEVSRYGVVSICTLDLTFGDIETLMSYNTDVIGSDGVTIFSDPSSSTFYTLTKRGDDKYQLDQIEIYSHDITSEQFTGLSKYINNMDITRVFQLSNGDICAEYKSNSTYTVANLSKMLKLCESILPTCGTDYIFYVDTDSKLSVMRVGEEESICYIIAEDVESFTTSYDYSRVAYTTSASASNAAKKLFVTDGYGVAHTLIDVASRFTSISMNLDGSVLVAAYPKTDSSSASSDSTKNMLTTYMLSDYDPELFTYEETIE